MESERRYVVNSGVSIRQSEFGNPDTCNPLHAFSFVFRHVLVLRYGIMGSYTMPNLVGKLVV